MEPLKKRQRLTPALTSLRDAPRSNLLKGGGVEPQRRAVELKLCIVNIRTGGCLLTWWACARGRMRDTPPLSCPDEGGACDYVTAGWRNRYPRRQGGKCRGILMVDVFGVDCLYGSRREWNEILSLPVAVRWYLEDTPTLIYVSVQAACTVTTLSTRIDFREK